MKIYTKTGDAGQTGLFGGERVSKDHLRIRTYGTLDELNASLGIVLSNPSLASDLRFILNRIQGELFQLGAELATPKNKEVKTELLGASHIVALEAEIDQMESSMKPLKSFILPGGTPDASNLHLARAISRRAERELVSLNRTEEVRPEALQYVNRLADHLFVCARYANHVAKVEDIPWVAPPKATKK